MMAIIPRNIRPLAFGKFLDRSLKRKRLSGGRRELTVQAPRTQLLQLPINRAGSHSAVNEVIVLIGPIKRLSFNDDSVINIYLQVRDHCPRANGVLLCLKNSPDAILARSSCPICCSDRKTAQLCLFRLVVTRYHANRLIIIVNEHLLSFEQTRRNEKQQRQVNDKYPQSKNPLKSKKNNLFFHYDFIRFGKNNEK